MFEEETKTTPSHLVHMGSPMPFEADERLDQLQTLMMMAYNGEDAKIEKPL